MFVPKAAFLSDTDAVSQRMGWHHQTTNHASTSIRIPGRGEEKEAQDTAKVNIMLILRYLVFLYTFFTISLIMTIYLMLMQRWLRSFPSFAILEFLYPQ